MERAGPGKRNSRTLAAAFALTLLCTLIAAVPAPAKGGESDGDSSAGGSAAYGGTKFDQRPVITGISCLSRCGARSASTSHRSISVRDSARLKVRGLNLSGVRAVIFTGRASTRDDVRVSPDGVGRLSVDVTVPRRASSGRIVLAAAIPSPPSPAAVVIAHKDQQAIDEGKQAPSPSRGLIWPVSSRTITSPFGEYRGDHYHSGIDIAAPTGTSVRAAAAGRVIWVGPQGGYGNFICIAHSTISTCYAHLSEFVTTVGANVSQGEVIGRSGCTGNCTGPHLHFEVRTGTAMWATPANPMSYLPGSSGQASAASYHAPLDYDLPVHGG
ncbi:MAG TPA: M23 family metallopeptidase [Solirubrobacteraceae bacterium]|nr:M23 family metallopeptidase [Solirubrobacteraceae bacterium]